jgi:Protein of unknown function (DUF3180)
MEDPKPPQQRPTVTPTNPATLIVAALVAASLAWFMISVWYSVIFPKQLPWIPAVTFGLLALFELVLANNTRARIGRRPGRPLVEPLLVARYVLLAKASSLAGAIFAGFFGGVVLWLLTQLRLAAAGKDLPPGIGAFVASLALIAAALWLEHSCRVPPRPEDKDDLGQGRNGNGDNRSGDGTGRSAYGADRSGAVTAREDDRR